MRRNNAGVKEYVLHWNGPGWYCFTLPEPGDVIAVWTYPPELDRWEIIERGKKRPADTYYLFDDEKRVLEIVGTTPRSGTTWGSEAAERNKVQT